MLSLIMENLLKELKALSDKNFAAHHARFFKTAKCQYGEGDKFWGLRVPQTRAVAAKYTHIPFSDVETLLHNEIHEVRFAALCILINKFKTEPDKTVCIYLKNTAYINNWDLVDLSAPNIIGKYFLDKDLSTLRSLAHSKNLWEERIAMVSTLTFIRKNKFGPTKEFAKLFITHKHDLMHKAAGWMLREMGKQNERALTDFLDENYQKLPRTALRYAIERLSPAQKAHYMAKF